MVRDNSINVALPFLFIRDGVFGQLPRKRKGEITLLCRAPGGHIPAAARTGKGGFFSRRIIAVLMLCF